jgi:hypothetical protein
LRICRHCVLTLLLRLKLGLPLFFHAQYIPGS